MISIATFVSILTVVFCQVFYPDKDCNFTYRLLVSQTLMINGPEKNGTFKPGASCRWIFTCPERYCCRLRCDYVELPYTPGCIEDMLLVSQLGSTQLIGADKYCGRTALNAKSVSRRMTIGLITSKSNPSGRLKCHVTTELAFKD